MRVPLRLLLCTLALAPCGCAERARNEAKAVEPPAAQGIERIGFGSCARQDRPQPVWDAVIALRPQAFIFLGDNIYADRKGAGPMREEYALLAAQPGFMKLREACPLVLATWDDHDFGKNDAGVEHLDKATSQRLFLEFWDEPPQSPRWERKGVYASHVLGPPGMRVQVILLDTRTFRSPLRRKATTQPDIGPYLPSTEPGATLLGEAQWAWLAEELKVRAELRLIGSSIQFIPDDQEWERWANFPHDQRRFLDLLKQTRASGVIILSGDRHFCELSRMGPEETGLPYPLYDLTSSSLNSPSKRPKGDYNRRRVGEASGAENFGMVRIDWAGGKRGAETVVTLEVRDVQGQPLISKQVRLGELRAR